MPSYFHRYTFKPSAPIVHIEVQPSGSATMTFKGVQFQGKVMNFKHPRDAEAHARVNGFETIQRKTHPQYFAIIPSYSPYAQETMEPAYAAFADDFDHGCYKD